MELNLKTNEKTALLELKKRLLERFHDMEIIIFGSKARGGYDKESDIDLLILVDAEVNTVLTVIKYRTERESGEEA